METAKKKLLKSEWHSFMRFMPEYVLWDDENMNVVRFRGMFEMPSWDGVEEDETTYIVESPNARLDKIASRFWGESRQHLYWIIAARNNLDIPSVSLYEGQRIKIPALNWIESSFLPQSQVYQ